MTTKTRTGMIAVIIVIILVIVVIVLQKMLVHAPASQVPSPSIKPLTTVTYSCNAGKGIAAIYHKESIDLTLSDGRTLTLPQTISADGTRYANSDESFVFWGKGNGALVLENNQEKSYIGCIVVAPQPKNQVLTKIYSNSADGFSIRIPEDFKITEQYHYQAPQPGKDIIGTKFTISNAIATGTNLSVDSYISVESIPNKTFCSAASFMMKGTKVSTTTQNGVEYSVATSSDAGAGNRYDQKVYAFSGTNPCLAVRYFIHYGVLANYPPGTRKQFDLQGLLSTFDEIRKTIVINQ